METPRLSEAHQKLQVIVGSWSGEERLQPSPWDPVGGPAEGRVDNRSALDGFAVVHDYTQSRDGRVSFQGHGVFRYDASEGIYQLHWFDSIGQAPSLFRGTCGGHVLRLQSSFAGGQNRASWDFTDPDRCHYRMEISRDGERWQTFIEGNYRRLTSRS